MPISFFHDDFLYNCKKDGNIESNDSISFNIALLSDCMDETIMKNEDDDEISSEIRGEQLGCVL